MNTSSAILQLIEKIVLWLGVGSLFLLALRAAALLVVLGREILTTYKTVLEIKEFMAKAKERERMVLAPLRESTYEYRPIRYV